MMNGSQRWNYGDWMLKAIAEKERKQRRAPRTPYSSDIHKYGIRLNKEGDVRVCNRKNGKALYEVESYDEARRLLNEEYEMGA